MWLARWSRNCCRKKRSCSFPRSGLLEPQTCITMSRSIPATVFLEDGRYAAGAWLCSPQEVMDYVEMQKPYQHRVLICDRDDFAVMEVVKEQVIFPNPKGA
mgnify:CR=1 FL=1